MEEVFNCLLLLLHMQYPGGHGLLNFQMLAFLMEVAFVKSVMKIMHIDHVVFKRPDIYRLCYNSIKEVGKLSPQHFR